MLGFAPLSSTPISALPETAQVITAVGLEVGTRVGKPAIGQVHALTATSIQAATELGKPEIVGVAALEAIGLKVSTEVGKPTARLIHDLTATGLKVATEVGNPTLNRIVHFTATGIKIGIELGKPIAHEANALQAIGIQAGSTVGSSALADFFALTTKVTGTFSADRQITSALTDEDDITTDADLDALITKTAVARSTITSSRTLPKDITA